MKGRGALGRISFGIILFLGNVIGAQAQLHRDYPEIGERNINKGRFGFPNTYSAAQEYAWGSDFDAELRGRLRPSPHHRARDYVQSLVDRLGANSDFNGGLTVFLSSSQDSLIFTTMGGYVYVDERLVRVAANESELAGALAHEIGHLAARHGSENITRQELIRSNPGWVSRLLESCMLATSLVTYSTTDGFWRAIGYSNEVEADELGTQYLWRSGFDPAALLNLLKRLEDQNVMDRPGGFSLFKFHPPFSLRKKRIVRVLKDLPLLETARLDSSRFVKIQQQLSSGLRRLGSN